MIRLFVIDWLLDYINTPAIDMTKSIELLGILSIGIIAFAVLGVIYGIWILIDFVRGKTK